MGVGKTVLKYFASEDGMLSFANNKPVKIFSKGAGTNPDLWGVMVRNQSGILVLPTLPESDFWRCKYRISHIVIIRFLPMPISDFLHCPNTMMTRQTRLRITVGSPF